MIKGNLKIQHKNKCFDYHKQTNVLLINKQNQKTIGKTTSTEHSSFPYRYRHLFIFQFPVHQVLKNIIKTPFTPELHNPGTMKRHQSLFYFIINKNLHSSIFRTSLFCRIISNRLTESFPLFYDAVSINSSGR